MAKKKKYEKINKKSGKGFCDQLWAMMVRIRHDRQCPICTTEGDLTPTELPNAHHLVSRRVFRYRWDTDNGIILCPKHHEFSLLLSAHTAPWAFEDWMKEHDPEKHKIWVHNRNNIETTEKAEYDIIYNNLEEEHFKLTGEYFRPERISSYRIFKFGEEIIMGAKMEGKTAASLAKEYHVKKNAIDKFLKTL